jgi:hypothetical protein
MAARRISASTPPPLLRRYTDLTSVIDLLTHKRLTLLDPASWDDRNDSYFIDHYRERSDYKSVLALCLSTVGETYHHWKVFCGHASGVCIAFHRQALLDVIDAAEGVRHGKVKYLRLEEIAEKPPRLNLSRSSSATRSGMSSNTGSSMNRRPTPRQRMRCRSR